MELDFRGKKVLITGASMGIGRGLSRCFAKDGANLFLTDLPSRHDQLVEVGIRIGDRPMASEPGPLYGSHGTQRTRDPV